MRRQKIAPTTLSHPKSPQVTLSHPRSPPMFPSKSPLSHPTDNDTDTDVGYEAAEMLVSHSRGLVTRDRTKQYLPEHTTAIAGGFCFCYHSGLGAGVSGKSVRPANHADGLP